jgi:nitrogen-specific signal transduction histidine kinase
MHNNIERQIAEATQCMGCMHEGVIITSAEGTILDTTPAAERILEAPSMSLKGRQIRELCPSLDAYDNLIRQTDFAERTLNKSLIMPAGNNKRIIVNMSIQRVGPRDGSGFVHVFQDCADLGTGLGLATSQQIVFEHNGHLVVESQPGKGSTFSTLLPI